MAIELKCPACGKVVEVDESSDLESIRCQCGQSIEVPRAKDAGDKSKEESGVDERVRIKVYTPRLKCKKCSHRIYLEEDTDKESLPKRCPECDGELILRFLCPKCKKKLEGTPAMVGEERACPGCSTKTKAGYIKVPLDDIVNKGDYESAVSRLDKDKQPKQPDEEEKPAESKEAERADAGKEKTEAKKPEPAQEKGEGEAEKEATESSAQETAADAKEKAEGEQAGEAEAGKEVPKEEEGAAAPAEAPHEDVAEGFRLVCDNCGSSLAPQSRYCPICGYDHETGKLPTSTPTVSDEMAGRLRERLLPNAAGIITLTSLVFFLLSLALVDTFLNVILGTSIVFGVVALSLCIFPVQLVAVLAEYDAYEYLKKAMKEFVSFGTTITYLMVLSWVFTLIALVTCVLGFAFFIKGVFFG